MNAAYLWKDGSHVRGICNSHNKNQKHIELFPISSSPHIFTLKLPAIACSCRETERCCLMFSPCPHCAGLPERHPVPAPLVCKRLTSHHTRLWCSCWWQRCIAGKEMDTCPLSQTEENRRGRRGSASIRRPQEETAQLKTQCSGRCNEETQTGCI